MTKTKNIILVIITLTTLIWAYYASQKVVSIQSDASIKNELLMPDLEKNIGKIGTVIIRSQGKSFKVRKKDGQWVMPNRYDYPVGVEKIRDLVRNSASIAILEKKTSDPKNFPDLGLDDPESENSKAIRIVFLDDKGKKKYADYVRGINRKGVSNAQNNKIYARLFKENQAYLVRGDLNFDLGAHALLSGETFGIRSDRIKSITFDYLKNTTDDFTIGKDIPGQPDFVLTNPADVKLKAFGKSNTISTALENMILQDIVLADKFPVKDYEVEITYKTFAGLTMYVKLFKHKDDNWLVIKAVAVNEKDKQAKEDADRINALAGRWVYKIDIKSIVGFSYKLADLIQE